MQIITTDTQCLTLMEYFEIGSSLFGLDKSLMFTYMMILWSQYIMTI